MRIGVLGAGQLGRMIGLAGAPLGLEFRFLDPTDEPSAGRTGECIRAAYDDRAALERFADGVDVVTYEFENVPAAATEFLEERVPVYPPRAALQAAQDRLEEKKIFGSLEIPVAPYVTVDTRAELDAAIAEIGLPAVLKTRRLGYDGKGQRVLREPGDAEAAFDELGGVPLILESFVSFERELSIIAVRGRDGRTATWPLVENRHEQGILRQTTAPAPDISERSIDPAREYAARLLDALDYTGVLALELFLREDELLVNEMAPRVHNSGHWTIEGSETSQFENHLRAIVGLPLGSTEPIGYSTMFNLIGSVPDLDDVLGVTGTHLHLYEKAPRPGRKVGHVTVHAEDEETLEHRVERLRRLMG